MLKKDLILRNPLRFMGLQAEEPLPRGSLGVVCARAGVGKTALLVQLALNSLLDSKNVLHLSLADPVKKVCLWYEEVFRNIAAQYQVDNMDQLWETILPHRFIMTFRYDGFSVPKLEERLNELIEQDIFLPRVLLVDGLPLDSRLKPTIGALKAMATTFGLHGWLTVRSHRDEPAGPQGLPTALDAVLNLLEAVVVLQPEGNQIHVKLVKGLPSGDTPPALRLDPNTMLIREPCA